MRACVRVLLLIWMPVIYISMHQSVKIFIYIINFHKMNAPSKGFYKYFSLSLSSCHSAAPRPRKSVSLTQIYFLLILIKSSQQLSRVIFRETIRKY